MSYFDVDREIKDTEARLDELREKIAQSTPGSDAWRTYRQAYRYWDLKLNELIPAMKRINSLLEEEI